MHWPTYAAVMQFAGMNKDLISIVLPEASFRLVLLHGWGADAEDLIPIGRELTRNLDFLFELVALRAPHLHPQGVGRQWYGLYPPDWLAVPEAINALSCRLRELETPSIPLRKTILFGFSQGGAMALAAGCNLPLAGLIACSAYPHPGWTPPKQSPPIILSHGENDEIVPCSASSQLINSLKLNQLNAELFLFEGGHEITPELLNRFQLTLRDWIN